jgi:hypothetical protein
MTSPNSSGLGNLFTQYGEDLNMVKSGLKIAFVCALLALGGCVCRPGHVGPYGGVHPGACWVETTTSAFV